MKISRKQQDIIGRLIAIIGLLLDTFFVGLSVFWMVCSLLRLNSEILAFPLEIIIKNFSFDTYISAFKDSEKLRLFTNGYFTARMVATLILLVAILASYAFSHYESPGRKIINIFIISVQAIPPTTLLIPYFGLMVASKLYDTYQGPIFAYTVPTLPYTIIMLAGYSSTLLRELDEVAKVDGSTSFGTLWRILVSVSIPDILSAVIYIFMITWNEYLSALTLTQTNDMRTVPIGIQLLVGQHSYDRNEMMTISVLGSIPVIILFIFFQRYFIGEMAPDSVKS